MTELPAAPSVPEQSRPSGAGAHPWELLARCAAGQMCCLQCSPSPSLAEKLEQESDGMGVW